MVDVLKNAYYESFLGCDTIDWLVEEVGKPKNKMAFYFKNINKDIIMTEEDEQPYGNTNICQFCEIPDKFRDHCDLTGKY